MGCGVVWVPAVRAKSLAISDAEGIGTIVKMFGGDDLWILAAVLSSWVRCFVVFGRSGIALLPHEDIGRD